MKGVIAFVFILITLAGKTQVPPITSVEINRLNTVLISPMPNTFHLGFPRIIKLPNDSLLLVYRKGSSHVDITGQLIKQFGSSDGLVWSGQELLYNDPIKDDRGASMVVLPDQSLFLHFYKNTIAFSTVYPPIPQFTSLFYCKSFDNGQTFTTPISIDNAPLSLPPGHIWNGTIYLDSLSNPLKSYASSSPALILGNKLIIPAYGGDCLAYLTASSCYGSDPQRLVFFESDDQVNWNKRIVNEDSLPNSWMLEPSIALLPNDNILIHIRTSDSICTPGGSGPMIQAVSNDFGQTFQGYKNFPFVGHAPILFKLSNGILLSGFRWTGPNSTNQKTAFVYSMNDGHTWSDTILVAAPGFDSGYPDFVELDNNTFMLVYYEVNGTAIQGVRYEINVTHQQTLGEIPVSIEEDSELLTVFPNPSNGIFNLSLEKTSIGKNHLRIFSSSGSIVWDENFETFGNSFYKTFEFSELANGIYYLELSSNDYNYQKQFLIAK